MAWTVSGEMVDEPRKYNIYEPEDFEGDELELKF